MIRKITLLFLLCLGMHNVVDAQYCGSDKAQQRLLAQDPSYAQKLQELTTNWVNWVNAHQNNPNALLFDNGVKRVFQIPVVIHVITPGNVAVGTTYNPTDAQLQGMIDYLNQTYNATWGAYPDSISGGVSIPIQFVLAQRDSMCNSTTGIERVNGAGVPNYVSGGVDNGSGTGASEVAVKNLSRWPVDEYYNVWIVNKIDGADGTQVGVPFTAGYAYLPPAPSNLDGIIMLATQAASGDITIPHEMGHALSVLHTFEGGTTTTCPPNNNCLTDGDQICDTQPEMQSNFNCPVDPNPCTGLSYDNVQHNFMDYSSCQDRFTNGQKMRMIMGLLTYRGNLIGSLGGEAPSTSVPASACVPTIANPSNSFDAGVYEVKIADNYNSAYIGNVPYTYLDYSSGGYNSDGNKAYIDRTCHQQANLAAGTTYKFYVRSGPSATGEKVGIYIDYNNDGTFSPSELVYSHTGTIANQLDSANITLPTFATMPSLVTCVPIRMRVISDRTTGAIDPCTIQNGQAEDYSIVIKGSSTNTGSVSISLPAGQDTTCYNSMLTFTAHPSAGLDSATTTYMWYVNNAATGVNADTLSTDTLSNGAAVNVKMYFLNGCGLQDSALSNTIIVHHDSVIAPRVSIALTVGNNPGCEGTTLTFTATPFNGGTNPSYQWFVNGLPVSGNTDTFTSSTLASGDTVTCSIESNSPCASPLSATSNAIGIVHYYLTGSISIAPDYNPACATAYVTFTSQTVNQSADATFQWYVNNVPVPGATGSSYITDSLHNLDIVKCIITDPSPCVVNHFDTSNQVVMTINSLIQPTVTDSIVSGNNPGCLDSLITFGASVSNFGNNPAITWLVNGIPTNTGYTFSTNSLQNGDQVVLQVNGTDGQCYTHDTMTIAPITLTLAITPDPPVVSLIGDLLVTNVSGNIIWYGPNGMIPNEHGQTYHPTQLGAYYAVLEDTSCPSRPSNVINISLLNIGTYNMGHVRIYPNPTNGKLILDWGTEQVNMKVTVYNALGQGVLYDEINNQNRKIIDVSMLPNGNYFVVLRDEHGNTGTASITVNK